MSYTLLGKNFTPPDVLSKVTGKAKYAEDFRTDGMLFCKLLSSPMPHANVRSIDASEALAMDGVVAVLTANDLPVIEGAEQRILTNEPCYVGDPILAVAAISETIAANAIEKIKLDLEPLPFTVDPLESLYPGGPNARTGGNSSGSFRGPFDTIKWTAKDFASVSEDEMPMSGKSKSEWEFGDLDEGFSNASIVYDESFVTAANSHHSMEPRSAMAYWQNGKCYVHGSTQSQSFIVPGLSKMLGIEPADLVLIAEFCGGGFGSKGAAYPVMAIPAYLSKKVGRPVMMRISREEEYFLGSARAGFQGRIKIGFDSHGKVTAVDLYIVQQSGPYAGFPDFDSAAGAVSFVYQPQAMRYRGVSVLTNTPPSGAQRGPGQNQIAMIVEPLMDKAAKELGIDQLSIRKINCPDNSSLYGGKQETVTSAYLREALDIGAKDFDWKTKSQQSGTRNGSKVIGIGVGQAYHSAGSNGFDGLVRITPDGILHIHSGIGNLGTYSYAGTSRVVAEVLRCDWDKCVIERGDSRKHLPWNLGQFGSNTSFTMARSNHAAAIDAKRKLLEIAAHKLGGEVKDYDIGGHKVFSIADPAKSISYAEAAQAAIELGGQYSGEEMPEDIFFLTKASTVGVAGSGLVGIAKDNYEKNGVVPGLAAAFIKIELDLETGEFEILDYVGTTDCGTVIHPMGMETQVKGGAVMGIGLATTERMVYDPQNGLPANVGLLNAKPPSYLDVPANMTAAAVNIADPQNPVGTKGLGEPVMGSAASALICAISDALGGHYFNRTPVVTDMILNAASGREQSHKSLQVNTF